MNETIVTEKKHLKHVVARAKAVAQAAEAAAKAARIAEEVSLDATCSVRFALTDAIRRCAALRRTTDIRPRCLWRRRRSPGTPRRRGRRCIC